MPSSEIKNVYVISNTRPVSGSSNINKEMNRIKVYGGGPYGPCRIIVAKYFEYRVSDSAHCHLSKEREQVAWLAHWIFPDHARLVSACGATWGK